MDHIHSLFTMLGQWWMSTPATEKAWLGVGFLAQLMFSMRFIVQWIASERARRSIVPETFWYFSMIGGAMLFAYAIYRLDPVFMLGQGASWVTALIVAAVVNLAGAGALAWWMFALIKELPFTALLRQLRGNAPQKPQ